MQIDRRITNGLAWAGLCIVVAIPVADAVSKQLMGDDHQVALATVVELPSVEAPIPAPLSQRPHAPVIETAAIAPTQPVVAKPVVPAVAKPVAAANPVVDSFLSSGKALPSYITGGDEPAQAVVAPAPAKPVVPAVTKPVVAPVETAVVAPAKPIVAPEAPVAIDPVEVAALPAANVAPMPMPLSMRPTPVTRPLATASRNDDIVLPPEVVANNNARPAAVVDDLRDWESGPLSEFLARRQGQQKSSATVTSDRAFPDGYYDDSNAVRRPRRDVYLGPVQDDAVFFPFVN
ncbi:hypothetical protein ABIB57_002511 [Devosia sp. UYZn731]|uniref:hypothetical protein n=1 Tax=Devosia sp. UYZn731 TaxID=3156345 RepID=UPI00339953C1